MKCLTCGADGEDFSCLNKNPAFCNLVENEDMKPWIFNAANDNHPDIIGHAEEIQ